VAEKPEDFASAFVFIWGKVSDLRQSRRLEIA